MTDETSQPPWRRANIFETLGAEIVEQREGFAHLRFLVLEAFTIGSGQLQGGLYAVMMDTAMAVACEGQLSTATMQVNLFRPTFTGQVLDVTGEVVRRGQRLLYAEAEVRDAEGRVVARGNQTGLPLRTVETEPPA